MRIPKHQRHMMEDMLDGEINPLDVGWTVSASVAERHCDALCKRGWARPLEESRPSPRFEGVYYGSYEITEKGVAALRLEQASEPAGSEEEPF